jgi:hypothetical protein
MLYKENKRSTTRPPGNSRDNDREHGTGSSVQAGESMEQSSESKEQRVVSREQRAESGDEVAGTEGYKCQSIPV